MDKPMSIFPVSKRKVKKVLCTSTIMSRNRYRTLQQENKRINLETLLNKLSLIGESELKMMRLPATTCREVNSKAADDSKIQFEEAKDKRQAKKRRITKTNCAFHIKSADSKHYGLSLPFKRLQSSYPSSMCPDTVGHLYKLLVQNVDLPRACPTCWSIQRNA
ncbi:hypothetical protein FSP39_014013 [Pinctada imbricata]|uniref:Uncharacterized protein n=1 Tax=Pinctada imbricata TaxID=66713 RepID=A0AA88YAC6_PINIB|nr:hypothetical protein FSP39_014013 [Pinctada imbricata]